MSAAITLREAAGRVLVVGVEGPQLSAMEAAWLRLLRPGGVILFRRNIESAGQTHALLQSVGQAVNGPQLRCIDVEGGTVDRLRDLIAPMPSPFEVASTHQPTLYEKHGSLIGQEVRMLGFNTTFAPVLDLRTAASAPVMTTRVVSDDPAAVIAYAAGFLKGLNQQGVLGCGKHFPGLGSGQVDSHHATPLITRSFAQMWEQDLLPYRRLAKQLPMVMVSHAAYSFSGDDPASVSSYWLTEVLTQKIGYKGLIVSDDMEMGGILSYVDNAEATVLALTRGTHGVEICRDPALVIAAYEQVLREAERSPAFARVLRYAAAKMRKVAAATPQKPPPSPTPTAVRRMQLAVQRFAHEVATAQPA